MLIFSLTISRVSSFQLFNCPFPFGVFSWCKMTSKNPHEIALDEFQRLSTFETRHALHIRVRSLCKEKKVGLKHLSKAYRGIVEQSLRELLDVTSLSSPQYTIIDNFCAQVPSFYSKKAKSLEDVCRLHGDYFKTVLKFSENGVDKFIEKKLIENDSVLDTV